MKRPERHRHLPTRAALGLAAALMSLAAQGVEVYRWTDANGKVQFGDKPPASGATTMTIHAEKATEDISRQQRTERLLNEFATERAERAEADKKQAKADAERAAACSDARNRDFEYQHSGYLYVWDDNGQKRVLSEAEHKSAKAKARADVAKWCE